MIRLCLTMVAHRGQARDLAAELRLLMALTLSEPGSLHCQLSIDFVDSRRLYYVEEWLTEQVFRTQLKSERFARLVAIMEAAAERPRFDIQLIVQSHGLDYVEEARRARC